jgi:ubiquinone/menaquinone biosynthesis C-methylase UbiE
MNPPTDLHAAFSRPAAAAVRDRVAFLRAVDGLPGLAPVRVALRGALEAAGAPSDGDTVVDVGCGLGLETARWAAEHPAATVVGLDHDPAILRAAREHAPDLPNLRWRLGDVTALDLPPGSVAVVRTERVLMYVGALGEAVESLRAALRPGGIHTGFELDYGATILPVAGAAPTTIRRFATRLEDALPQPWAGRLVPEALAAAGMSVLGVEPFSFSVDVRVWSRIVADTLRAADDPGALDDLEDWLGAVETDAPFRAVFTGLCTTARRP